MITPNKFTPHDQSILGKLPTILCHTEKEIKIADLFEATRKKFEHPDQFIYALDMLYVLKKIDVDFDRKTVQSAS